MPKVSVIVPVFNVEQYIERCARSLFEQTLDDIEYIFVDDCTQDQSIDVLVDVLSDYPNRKQQVKIIHHQQNKGLPIARKTGLSVAKGDFIIHCDSDDWVDLQMYSSMYEKAIKENADIVVCDYSVHDGLNLIKSVQGCHSIDINRFKENLLFQKDCWAVWNKMFRRTVYNDVMIFPEKNMGEDMAIVSQLILNCNRLVYIPFSFYFYYVNPESITKKLSIQTILNNFEAIKSNTDIVLCCYKDRSNPCLNSGLLYLKYNVKAHLFPIVHIKEYRSLFINTYPGIIWKMILDFRFPKKCVFKYVLSLLGFYLRKIDR